MVIKNRVTFPIRVKMSLFSFRASSKYFPDFFALASLFDRRSIQPFRTIPYKTMIPILNKQQNK